MKFTGTKSAPIIRVNANTVVRHASAESVCINGGTVGCVLWGEVKGYIGGQAIAGCTGAWHG